MLSSRVVLITGAGGGIGRGIAQAVMKRGAAVIVTDVDADSANGTAKILADEYDAEDVMAAAMDITDRDAVADTIEAGVARFGKIDGLVNNAAVLADPGPLLDSDPAKRQKEVEVNLGGTIICSQAFVRQVIKQKTGGNIVNLASEGGLRAHVMMANYSVTKAGVINLTQAQSAEWCRYGINVNAICPGGIHTDMLQAAAEAKSTNSDRTATALRETWVAPQLGRKMEAIEVGYVAAFLLSEEAVLIRGQAIRVSGGLEHENLQDYDM